MRVVLLSLLLTGCSTVVPVTNTFPNAPSDIALARCPQLQKIADNAQLSDVAKTVTINYGTYYECAVKLDAWILWYSAQKLIFESAGK